MKRKTKKHSGSVQGHALLYGRSSKAIRIVHGEIVRSAKKKDHDCKTYSEILGRVEKKNHSSKKNSGLEKKVQRKYVMNEDTKKKIDKLKDPLTLISRDARSQKYEAAKSTEKYEYGLSDW